MTNSAPSKRCAHWRSVCARPSGRFTRGRWWRTAHSTPALRARGPRLRARALPVPRPPDCLRAEARVLEADAAALEQSAPPDEILDCGSPRSGAAGRPPSARRGLAQPSGCRHPSPCRGCGSGRDPHCAANAEACPRGRLRCREDAPAGLAHPITQVEELCAGAQLERGRARVEAVADAVGARQRVGEANPGVDRLRNRAA